MKLSAKRWASMIRRAPQACLQGVLLIIEAVRRQPQLHNIARASPARRREKGRAADFISSGVAPQACLQGVLLVIEAVRRQPQLHNIARASPARRREKGRAADFISSGVAPQKHTPADMLTTCAKSSMPDYFFLLDGPYV
ncbi:MAG: hypothetical protein ACI3ZT_08080 [Candidatus Cryptobacteroides sp.]